jgi:hypothetical protein
MRAREGSAAGRPHRQPSLFGVEATDPTPEDLAGLLAGPGELGRMGGTARVSVPVDAAWRVHALIAEFAVRGLPAGWEPTGPAGFLVRTAYTVRLLPLARVWSDGAGKRAPAPLHLNGQAMRLWAAAAGSGTPDGYVLRLGPRDEASWPVVGAALQALGLAAALLAPGSGGPAYRITGRRRLARLAELVGEPPVATPPDSWPSPPVRRS